VTVPSTLPLVVYASHGIKGKTEAEIIELEARASAWCLANNRRVLLPRTIPVFDHTGKPCPAGMSAGEDASHAHACFMRSDLIAMLRDADEILMMPGWERSVGARAELDVALTCGMPVHFYERTTTS
jgi:hypothetical protein